MNNDLKGSAVSPEFDGIAVGDDQRIGRAKLCLARTPAQIMSDG